MFDGPVALCNFPRSTHHLRKSLETFVRRVLFGTAAALVALAVVAPAASADSYCWTIRVGNRPSPQVCTPIPIDPR